MMTPDEHCRLVGCIVTNLQSLEFVLRLFLYEATGEKGLFEATGQKEVLPQRGDTKVPETWLTKYTSLSKMVGAYKAELTDTERPEFCVDGTVVKIRDALAHGALRSLEPTPPWTLFKCGKGGKGEKRYVPVEWIVELNEEWLNKKVALTGHQIRRVVECAKARGYEGIG